MPSARFQQLAVGSNGCYPFLKRTAVQSALPFPSGSWRVLEQTPRSWVAVKSLLCALSLDCFLSVRPAASAPEEFSVFFSKTEKNAARVPLQPPTRQTSPSQMLICFRTRGPVWHSPHTPLLQRNLGRHPLSPHHPLPATTTGCSPAGQIKHPRHELCFWDICLCCMSALFSPLHADSHLSGHTAIWVSFASALCVCCWAELPLPEPLPTWRSTGAPGMLGTPCAFTGVSV